MAGAPRLIAVAKGDTQMKIEQPGGHLDQMLRQTRGNLLQLSSMADMKSSMLLTISSVVMTLGGRYISDPHLGIAVVVLGAFCLLTVGLATYAAMPKVPIAGSGNADVEDRRFNLFFFGDFVRMDYEHFHDAMEHVMNDPSRTYEMQVREVYTLGRFLAERKYRYLRLAYVTFIAGLAVSGAMVVLSKVSG
jgi:hypothetical protein